ncbi:hypothetical protein Pflav_029800 [Phytohabitans flavus]|uniref:VOC domain-containing protein n=1 Tax=Phytohabitans flavus TaxID=1076124 RepID=A0A6F8XRX1_9ACTN|nr:VOC family protein [Phytohabitans flavus]BCB76570.1 hypothetical protein Pflav_029800 [Phytohabitans flavus]
MTAPDIVRSAYAELVVTDLARSRWFWVDMLGMVVQHEEADALYLRGFDELTHHSLVLRRGETPAADRLAFRVRRPEDLDRAEAFFAARGCPVKRFPAGTTPGVGRASAPKTRWASWSSSSTRSSRSSGCTSATTCATARR